MGAMFFGQYLLSKGVISREALIDAIELQRRSNLSLTELAVRKGYMSEQQQASILARYRTSDADLEALCLESGSINREQLDELIAVQRSDWVRIGAALVESGHLTVEEVDENLAEFSESQREADVRLEADFQACPDPEMVRTVVELSLFHLGRLTDNPVKLRGLSTDTGRLAAGRRRYAQKLVGDRQLHVVLDLPPKIASVVAEGLVGMRFDEGSEAARDAVCEFVNIIGGNACTHLESSGCTLRPEPPFSTDGDEPSGESRAVVRADVLAGETELDVRVFV
jgi:chemotaxis protein CheY-P-specific phosphatase CheC